MNPTEISNEARESTNRIVNECAELGLCVPFRPVEAEIQKAINTATKELRDLVVHQEARIKLLAKAAAPFWPTYEQELHQLNVDAEETQLYKPLRDAECDQLREQLERANKNTPEAIQVLLESNATELQELREQLAASHAELERLRDIVGEEDVASINAVLDESRNP